MSWDFVTVLGHLNHCVTNHSKPSNTDFEASALGRQRHFLLLLCKSFPYYADTLDATLRSLQSYVRIVYFKLF